MHLIPHNLCSGNLCLVCWPPLLQKHCQKLCKEIQKKNTRRRCNNPPYAKTLYDIAILSFSSMKYMTLFMYHALEKKKDFIYDINSLLLHIPYLWAYTHGSHDNNGNNTAFTIL